ncbi:hypothetical protein DVH05_020074 [Phytophthora capsici]|nr:hypothetical protein DVH05_020074 [Phytophthora capsici]
MARISPIERLPAFTVVSYHETKASALTAMELYDAHSYIHSHNDSKRGKAVTYKCAEHDKCGRFYRVRRTRATESAIMSFVLEVKGHFQEFVRSDHDYTPRIPQRLYAVEGQQNDGVFAAADGTYKLY